MNQKTEVQTMFTVLIMHRCFPHNKKALVRWDRKSVQAVCNKFPTPTTGCHCAKQQCKPHSASLTEPASQSLHSNHSVSKEPYLSI